ncbi:alpha/beta hydrolase family protein [Lederbergia graminis]|uniref:Alpha/beta hydrolase family protein n=1 Tax=Lederbergia graminis TaxID=735518 RepID=A0ABW0LKY7_9BACI
MQPIQFPVEGEVIRGTLHVPSETKGKVPGVLIIPGFADTAVGPHNLHVQMARELCQQGFAVLRFDYRGQGESDGEFVDFTIESGLADARAALQFLAEQPEVDSDRLGVVGFSLGGMLAVQLASETECVRALSLLAPVAYPVKVFRSFFQASHLQEIEQQGWTDWLGWKVGKGFLDGLDFLNPVESMKAVKAKTTLFHGTDDEEVPIENAHAFGVEVTWLDNGDHQFSSFKLKDAVIELTADWFRRHVRN